MQDTLSVCQHGRPVKYGCNKCYFNQDVETITIKKSLWDEMLAYKQKIDLLADGYISHNKEIKDIKEEQKLDWSHFQLYIKEIDPKIKKLEEETNEQHGSEFAVLADLGVERQTRDVQISIISDRLNKIEDYLKKLSNFPVADVGATIKHIDALNERIVELENWSKSPKHDALKNNVLERLGKIESLIKEVDQRLHDLELSEILQKQISQLHEQRLNELDPRNPDNIKTMNCDRCGTPLIRIMYHGINNTKYCSSTCHEATDL